MTVRKMVRFYLLMSISVDPREEGLAAQKPKPKPAEETELISICLDLFRTIKIESNLSAYLKEELIHLLKKFADIFTSTHAEIPDIDPEYVRSPS